jgi:hypothetical protein
MTQSPSPNMNMTTTPTLNTIMTLTTLCLWPQLAIDVMVIELCYSRLGIATEWGKMIMRDRQQITEVDEKATVNGSL